MGYFIFVLVLLALAFVALALPVRKDEVVTTTDIPMDAVIAAYKQHDTADQWAMSLAWLGQVDVEAEAFVNQATWAYHKAKLRASYEAQVALLADNMHWVNASTWAYLAMVVGQPKGGQDVFGRWYNPRLRMWEI
jgi:hypothetical protein